MQQMTDADINQIYKQCINFLKEKVSYCFQSRQANLTNWVLGTWSMKTQCLTTLKKGTEVDEAKVATATNQNQARRPNTQLGRQMAMNPMQHYRQQQYVERLVLNTQQQETKTQDDEHEDLANDFCTAFQDVELSVVSHA